MGKKSNAFEKSYKSLLKALINDFRGFIVNGEKFVKVPDDSLHILIAFDKMKEINPDYHKPGTGQNPVVDYMKEGAIYITRIPDSNKTDGFQRTVGILTDNYRDKVIFRGAEVCQYEILREIALGMGYDVDEYTLQRRTENSVSTPVSIKTYKSHVERRINHNSKENVTNRKIPEGSQPVVVEGKLIGFIQNGKFKNITHYSYGEKLNNGNKNGHGER